MIWYLTIFGPFEFCICVFLVASSSSELEVSEVGARGKKQTSGSMSRSSISSLELVLGICSKRTSFALLGVQFWSRDTDELGLGVNGDSTLCA